MSVDILTDLRDTADTLTNPYQHREPRWEWDHNRHRKPLPPHEVTLPGLLAQLGDMAYPGGQADDTASTRSVPRSRPPGNPKAITAYLDIHIAVARWHMMLCIVMRDTIESSVRQLLGRVATEPSDVQAELLADMRRWRYTCEIVTRWRDPDPQLQAPCPADRCGERALRVNLAERTARCVACGSRWAENVDEAAGIYSIGVLARHIQTYTAAADAAADGARQVERDRKIRRAGRSAA